MQQTLLSLPFVLQGLHVPHSNWLQHNKANTPLHDGEKKPVFAGFFYLNLQQKE